MLSNLTQSLSVCVRRVDVSLHHLSLQLVALVSCRPPTGEVLQFYNAKHVSVFVSHQMFMMELRTVSQEDRGLIVVSFIPCSHS